MWSGVPPYVKPLIGLCTAAHAWLTRPRCAVGCRLDGATWFLASGGNENRHILTAATYTRYWAELVFEQPGGGPRRVLVWRDALTPPVWRALVVHLREAGADAVGQPEPAVQGRVLDVRRHDE